MRRAGRIGRCESPYRSRAELGERGIETKAELEVDAVLSPTLNFVPGRGLRFAISFDDQSPQVIDALARNSQADWETSVKDAVRHVTSTHVVPAPGYHTLRFWMVDPGVVLEKLVVDLGRVKPSYLGPPESYRGAPGALLRP